MTLSCSRRTDRAESIGASGHNYGLTITLPSSYWYLQNFDIVNIEPLVDWFNVMTYDVSFTDMDCTLILRPPKIIESWNHAPPPAPSTFEPFAHKVELS